MDYGERLEWLEDRRKEYAEQQQAGFLSGEGRAGRERAQRHYPTTEEEKQHDPQRVAAAYHELSARQILILSAATGIARELGVSVEELGWYCYHDEWQKYTAKVDREHLAVCTDPACDAAICRKARCLPPLTQEELDGWKRTPEAQALKLKQQARWERWKRRYYQRTKNGKP
jgi:hypothetical protein